MLREPERSGVPKVIAEGISVEIPVKGNAWRFISAFFQAWWQGTDYVRINIDKANIQVKDVRTVPQEGVDHG
jgi:uncharacterized protein YraI